MPADWFTSAGPNGVSFEDIIELSNATHKDMWINVPALATTDFVTHLANLIYRRLDPGLNVYVEYSNETWNNSFLENAQVYAAGQANPIVDRSGDIVAQQTACMTKIIGDNFKTAFGSESSRVLPVVGGFAAIPSYNTDELQFLQQHYGNPSSSIYALAIAPYIDLASGTDVPGITMDQLFASVFQSLNSTFPQMLDANLAVARSYNVGLVSYEGGQSFNPYNGINLALKQQAQSDPRMYSFYQTMMQIWDQHVGSLFNFSTLDDPFWGLLPSISSPGSPKWDGVISALQPVGDANLDGVVDSKDQAIVAADQDVTRAWWEQGDFNHDGVVNQTDLAIVENNAGPIADTGFEQVQVGAGQFQYRPTGSRWTFSGDAGISANNSGFTAGNPAAPEGTQVAFLQKTGSISQTTGDWVAGNYVLTFDAAQRGNFQASRQDFQVLVDGVVVGAFTPSSTSYKTYTTSMFTVGAGSHTITFHGLDSAGGDNTAFIDRIIIA